MYRYLQKFHYPRYLKISSDFDTFKCAKAHKNVCPVTKAGKVYCRTNMWSEKLYTMSERKMYCNDGCKFLNIHPRERERVKQTNKIKTTVPIHTTKARFALAGVCAIGGVGGGAGIARDSDCSVHREKTNNQQYGYGKYYIQCFLLSAPRSSAPSYTRRSKH